MGDSGVIPSFRHVSEEGPYALPIWMDEHSKTGSRARVCLLQAAAAAGAWGMALYCTCIAFAPSVVYSTVRRATHL
jgi:hypothetical protein